MKDKKTLITIIILLVIFLPLGAIGTVKHFSTPKENAPSGSDNPNKEFILNNKVYFYVKDELKSIYDCDNCTIADTFIDDAEFHTNYYKDGKEVLTGVINDYFSVFKKGNSYILYNVSGKSILNEYNNIKNYNVLSTNNFLITYKSSGCGIIFLGLGKKAIQNDYDYISVPSHLNNGVLDASKFIVKKNNLWYILKEDGTAVNNAISSEIVDFNDNYYVTYDNGYHIYDYENVEYLSELNKTNVYGVGDYLFVVNNKQLFIYKDVSNNMLKFVMLPEYEDLYFSITSEGINIIIDGNVSQTLELS